MAQNQGSIMDLEYAIVSKSYQQAEQILINLVQLYTEDKVELTLAPFNRQLTAEQQILESYQVIEKLAAHITTWFSDWNYTPSDTMFSFMCLQKNFLNNLFSASSYHSTDHIIANLGLLNKNDFNRVELKRLLFVVTLESAIELPWQVLFKHMPDESIKVFAGQLRSISMQMSERAQKSISALVEAASIAPTVHTDEAQNLSPLIATFFNCSNIAHNNKYDIKKWIVKAIAGFLQSYLSPGLKKRLDNDVKVKPQFKEKAKVLVFHEFYHNNHAMYRGHHPRIAALKEHFDTVGMGIDINFDDLGQQDFHHVELIAEKDKLNFELMIKKILKIQPDVIFYPSVGMSMYIPFIASLRLAPIQIASAGHPASTYIDTIDYFHCLDVGVDKQIMESIIHEKWLPIKRQGLFRKEVDIDLKPSGLDKSKKNVVVNGVIQKVSAQVINACKTISEQSETQPIFHFFMAHPKQDIEFFSAQSQLRRFLPNSVLHPFFSYSQYMSVLNDSDFAISTFPFGGTNSNLDLVRLNKAKLFITDQSDISGLTDYDIWGSLNWLQGQCEDVPQLVSRAVEWINSPDILEQFEQQMKDQNLMGQLNQGQQLDIDSELVSHIEKLVN